MLLLLRKSVRPATARDIRPWNNRPNPTAGYIRRLARNAAGRDGSRRARFYAAVESGCGPRQRSDRI